MELSVYFKSIIDQDRCPVVVCNLKHEILYMNPAAIARYDNRGGAALVGQSLLLCHNAQSQERIKTTIRWFQENVEHNSVFESHNERENKDVYMVALRDEAGTLIGYYEKHEYRSTETEKTYNFW